MSRHLVEEIRESIRSALDHLTTSGGYQTYAGEHGNALARDLSLLHDGAGVLLTSSGTAALEIALRAAKIGPGDEVLLSSYDYPGNFWAIERVGARPVILDVEPNGWNIDLQLLEQAISEPNAIRGMIVSHLHGQLQEIAMLRSWCDQHGLLLVEDSCQAIGARINGRSSGTTGHVGIASFGGGKVLSAGRGGCLLIHDEELLLRARVAAGAGSGPYAMSELQAVVVASQLRWLPEINAACFNYFQHLTGQLQAIENSEFQHLCPAFNLIRPDGERTQQPTFYQCGWLLAPSVASLDRARFVENLSQAGLLVGMGFPGFHRRSSRRCRIVHRCLVHPQQCTAIEGNILSEDSKAPIATLPNATAVAERTWVIHHRQALESKPQIDEAVAIINAATRDSSPHS